MAGWLDESAMWRAEGGDALLVGGGICEVGGAEAG